MFPKCEDNVTSCDVCANCLKVLLLFPSYHSNKLYLVMIILRLFLYLGQNSLSGEITVSCITNTYCLISAQVYHDHTKAVWGEQLSVRSFRKQRLDVILNVSLWFQSRQFVPEHLRHNPGHLTALCAQTCSVSSPLLSLSFLSFLCPFPATEPRLFSPFGLFSFHHFSPPSIFHSFIKDGCQAEKHSKQNPVWFETDFTEKRR